jgi:cobalt-precorrin-5B (C1)-methyltransferase
VEQGGITISETVDWRDTVTEGRHLKRGYSTGSCAAAAAKAAAKMLFDADDLTIIELDTPAGIRLHLPVEDIVRAAGSVSCAVRKDAGDDPDITNGVLIGARAIAMNQPGLTLTAGKGIGLVTKPGLQVAVGRPAINPVPEKMILSAVAAVIPAGRGVEIEISIPDGERLAKKTMNARLGIVGGLSILGTSGLVEPLSEQSYRDTLALEIGALKQEYSGPLVLVTGNFGKQLALDHFGLPEQALVKIGNLVGFALDRSLESDFNKILIIGHIGKLIKVTAGIFNTHSRVADARFEIFVAHAALLGAGRETFKTLEEAVTTEEMCDILAQLGGADLFDNLAAKISGRSRAFLHDEVKIGTVIFNFRRGLLGMDRQAKKIIKEFKKERAIE